MADEVGGGVSGAGAAATDKDGGGEGRGAPGTSYCITDVFFVYLASNVYDGKPALPKCAAPGCVFVHEIPRAPLSAAQKADLVRVSALIRGFPQRHAVLLKGLRARHSATCSPGSVTCYRKLRVWDFSHRVFYYPGACA